MEELIAALEKAIIDEGTNASTASSEAVGHTQFLSKLKNRGSSQRLHPIEGLIKFAAELNLDLQLVPLGSKVIEERDRLPQSILGFAETRAIMENPALAPKPDQLFLPIPFSRKVRQEQGAGPISFRQDWFDELGSSPDNLSFVRITGSAMEPEIAKGALVLIDESQTTLERGGIYVVGGNTIDARRVDFLEGKTAFYVKSRPDQDVSLEKWDTAADGRPAGRVVWVGRGFD